MLMHKPPPLSKSRSAGVSTDRTQFCSSCAPWVQASEYAYRWSGIADASLMSPLPSVRLPLCRMRVADLLGHLSASRPRAVGEARERALLAVEPVLELVALGARPVVAVRGAEL